MQVAPQPSSHEAYSARKSAMLSVVVLVGSFIAGHIDYVTVAAHTNNGFVVTMSLHLSMAKRFAMTADGIDGDDSKHDSGEDTPK